MRDERGPLHQPMAHESGAKHVTGEAQYVDDLQVAGMLVAQVLTSAHAHAKLRRIDVQRALLVPGVVAVLTHLDIPGENNVGPVIHDEPLFAKDTVRFMGQSVALVVATTYDAARAGVKAIDIDYEVWPALTTLDEAIAAESWLCDVHAMQRGEAESALAKAPLRLRGEVRTGGQDHFYLETQCTLAVPEEGPALRLFCSTQHPTEVQSIVAHVLGWGRHRVALEVPRLGGGFGGKETQAAPYAAMAALAAVKLKRPVKVWLNRDQDMMCTGKRHPFVSHFEVGFTQRGEVLALTAQLFADGGFSTDLSRAILDRALFHADNAYFLPHVKLTGRVAKTNLPSNTAFRGFGGPQGMALVEDVMSRIAEQLELDPAEVRRRNFYGEAPRHLTPYWQEVTDNRLPRVWAEVLERSQYTARRAAIEESNRQGKWVKRGIAVTPVKFGISFTTSFLNQAGAFVIIYADGTVQLNHGGTEMGQGLHTKMLVVAAHELGISPERIRVMTTATDKVPNTSATAASSGSDLNGQAVRQACVTLRERLQPIAARMLGLPIESGPHIAFAGNAAFLPSHPDRKVPFDQLTQEAYLSQVSLFATGYYRTPDLRYDRVTARGSPFHYFAYGAAVSEVEVSGLTGEFRLRRVDIVHDVGASLVPTIDLGQIEGGFVQGLGWLTCEEVIFDEKGFLKTHSPDTYKIPACGDAPGQFNVTLLENAAQAGVIHGSKAVGEPPLMLALSIVAALRHAVSAFTAQPGRPVQLSMPCTPEALLFAIERARAS